MRNYWLLACLGFLAAFELQADTTAAQRMNVLLIMADDLRCDLGCYGSGVSHTPNLDRLAARAVRFERCYCQFPLCNPSRTSMLTGLRPTTTGVLGNRHWFGQMAPQAVSLPQYFRQQGYATLRAGKVFHRGLDDTSAWTEGGEERFFGPDASAPVPVVDRDERSFDAHTGRVISKSERSDRWLVLQDEGKDHVDFRTASRAIEYLLAERNEPFLLCCGFNKPHSPLEAPQFCYDAIPPEKVHLPLDFAPRPQLPAGFPAGAIRRSNADLFVGRDATPDQARQMIRAYHASTAWVDYNVGRVLQELDALGLRERTIVLFWSDHGYQLGEKGKWSKAGSLWEQGLRTPLVIYDPRAQCHGHTYTGIVEAIDLYPTLVELCGLPAVSGLEGHSLAPQLASPQNATERQAVSVWSEDGSTIAGVSVRTDRWHYAEFFGRGAGRMLIDPQADPHELTNLAELPEHQSVIEGLSEIARAHAKVKQP